MSRPEKEQAPVPGMITCLVTPKLTFSVPRDARWRTAADVPQQALQRGFAHRFPLPPVNLDKLRFESVGSTKVLADTAVYRLTSSEEGDERILASLLKGLEAAVDTKHRASLEKARTDLLASSATFQVMAGEVKERQDEGRRALDREVLKLNASLATTSKRLFLLERENASLKTQTSATRALQGATDSRLDALEAENSNLKARNASLEEALAALLERCDAHAARLDACEARAVAPPPPPPTNVAADTQTELFITDESARVLAVSKRPALSPRAAPFEPSEGVAEYKAAPEDIPAEGVRESKAQS